MFNKTWLPILALSAVLLGGCADEDAFDMWSLTGAEGESDLFGEGSLQTRGAALVGSIGPVSGLNHSATGVSAWSSGYWSSIEVVVDKGNEAAMALLDITGDLRELADGQTHVYRGGVWGEGQHISVLGCSGPEVGYWDYDEPASEVEVSVVVADHNPNVYTIHFTASFGALAEDLAVGAPGSQVTGSVAVVME